MTKHHSHPEPKADTDAGAEPATQTIGDAEQPDELVVLRTELEAAQAKATDNWNQFLRATAELDNFRKRSDRDMSAIRKYGVERLAGDLLAVRDSLEMGLAAARGQDGQVGALADGLDLTLKQLVAVMDRHDIKPVEPQGETFNPELHQAMTALETADHPPNTVIQVLQKGYRLHDRLLRPAMVVVAKAPAADPTSGLPPGSP